ncbi:hypothetical protein AB0I91_42925 [Actinosynnema sp. NPDC049800]
MKPRNVIATLLMVLGLVLSTAPGAMAISDAWSHPDGVARMSYDDSGDIYKICDTKTDDVGVSGRLNVRQRDGSWNHFAWIRDGNGNNDDCTSNNVDVLLENADYTFTICQQNTSDGARYNCATSPRIKGEDD